MGFFITQIMNLTCYPKINLGLKVHPLDEFGYHPIQSLFFYAVGEVKDEIQISSNDSTAIDIPGFEISQTDNIVYKAYLALLNNKVNLHNHLIKIEKKIPTGAGLGGGSSNAGVYLKTFGKELSKLSDIARNLGADVPFFLQNKACFVSGHGEILEPLSEKIKIPALLITPKIHSNTGSIFRIFDELPQSNWTYDPDAILHYLKSADCKLHDILHNDLELAACKANPKLALVYSELRKILSNRSFYCGMSGSGSAFFALFKTRMLAKTIAPKLQILGYPVHETTLCSEIKG